MPFGHTFAMPVYYFVIQPDQFPTDPDPVELPDDRAAWKEAVRSAGEIIKDLDGSFEVGSEWSLQIQDAEHKPLSTIKIIAETHE
jgi:hypothetical protein